MFMTEKMNSDMLKEKEGIIYKVLQADDLEQTIKCISEVFPRNEPTTKELGITPFEFYSYAEIYCKKALKEGLSVVAKDKVTGNVIGFCISEDLASEPPEGIEMINPKFHPVMALLNSLDEEYKKSHKVEKGQILHLVMAGVSQHYEGRNVVTTLTAENLKHAKLKNYSGAVAEATGLVSQHIARDKLGFKEMFEIEYKSFIYGEKHIFKNIENSPSCILLEKQF